MKAWLGFGAALTVLGGAATGCAGSSTQASEAQLPEGAAVAALHSGAERDAPEPMLERTTDEDTRWLDVAQLVECPYDDDDELPDFAPVDDADVPSFAAGGHRATNRFDSDDMRSNASLLRDLTPATSAVMGCLSLAACYDGDVPAGSIELTFDLRAEGRVSRVDVDVSQDLDRWGVVSCARRAIYDTEFPVHAGTDMFVSYRIDLD